MPAPEHEQLLEVVEICAGAGGQTLGLERAGFRHRLAVELDENAANTLRNNLHRFLGYDKEEAWSTVRVGDVADPAVWNPDEFKGRNLDLLAGGVPCPPFSVAGKQLGAGDERDLFAWAIELCDKIKPKALLLENVRGLSANRFTGYRQYVLDRLRDQGYIAEWRLLQANDYGVSQLRPRFVLVALRPEYAKYFKWPEKHSEQAATVGERLKDLMESNGWDEDQVAKWVQNANRIAPTIVGGSKKHGGADLGPTRAKRAWAELAVDAMGVADEPPQRGWTPAPGKPGPKLTTRMVARIQGWDDIVLNDEDTPWDPDVDDREFLWGFTGRKTSVYRQIGNAFPPPVAKAIGVAIRDAIRQVGEPRVLVEHENPVLDPVYKLLTESARPLTVEQIVDKLAAVGVVMEQPEVERHLNHLSRDFTLISRPRSNGAPAYSLEGINAFVGQRDHERHVLFAQNRAKIS
ncbi:DNA (cytosine-5-)-methyltransferase [Streptomyces sp. NPDC046275]|uniref:DNA cytosine methyltransferase n=1 Tax=Streptomyces sp. NPDC046275 TaxID=3157201 RepID=UPI0033E42FE2